MRMFRKFAAALMVMVMMLTTAAAETTFLLHSNDWSLEETPLCVTVSAQVAARMPYDENRSAMLSQTLEKLTMRLTLDGDEGSMALLAGEEEALKLAYKGNEVQISTIPELTFMSGGDAMSLLLGSETVGSGFLFGLRSDAETLLEDGIALVGNMSPAFDAYEDRRPVKTNIADMGVARSCTDYIVPKGDEEKWKEALLSVCPDGWLKEILSSLTFSGKQSLRVYRTEDEVPLRMEYNGTCGVRDDLRTVKVVWRLRRDDTARRDELSLTSPAKTGTNKNTLEFTRVVKANKKGALEMDGSFTYTVTANRQTTTRSGKFELVNDATETQDVISGSITLRQKLPGETNTTGLRFTPEWTVAGSAENPDVQGTLRLETLQGENVLNDVTFRLGVQRSGESQWEEREETLDLDLLTAEELEILRGDVLSSATTAIVRPLILLMGENADWFFRDMTPEQISTVMDAAANGAAE